MFQCIADQITKKSLYIIICGIYIVFGQIQSSMLSPSGISLFEISYPVVFLVLGALL